jgi:hypothetical protein
MIDLPESTLRVGVDERAFVMCYKLAGVRGYGGLNLQCKRDQDVTSARHGYSDERRCRDTRERHRVEERVRSLQDR